MTTLQTTETWASLLAEEKQKPYFQSILATLKEQQAAGKTIYPPAPDIFNAFKFTPFESIRVVILGQDPYHGAGQAHGLCFSVRPGIKLPPSLKNIFLELNNDIGVPIPNHGYLEKWAHQGVLMLNTVLTVEAGKPQSHSKIGWEIFTDKVMEVINTHKEGVIFLLWGSPAQQKGRLIDLNRHHVLKAPHPSPLSAHRGFLGCQHFSKTNALLRNTGQEAIDWGI